MREREFRRTLRVFESLLPPVFGVPYRVAHAREFLGDFLRYGPWTGRWALRAAVWMVHLAPPLALCRPRTFAGLDAAARERVLVWLYHHRRYLPRQLLYLARMFASFALLGDRQVLRATGLRGAEPHPLT